MDPDEHRPQTCPAANKLTQDETDAIILRLLDPDDVPKPRTQDAHAFVWKWLSKYNITDWLDIIIDRDEEFYDFQQLDDWVMHVKIDGVLTSIRYWTRYGNEGFDKLHVKIAFAIEMFGDRMVPYRIRRL
jgi:hypothetical protein